METNYLTILTALIKRRHFICWATIGFTLFSLIISILIKPKYQAVATLMPPVSQSTNIMSLMMKGNLMTDPEIGGTGFMPGMITPSDIFAYMLRSGPVAEVVINECNLIEHYKKKKIYSKNKEKALYIIGKKLKNSTKIKVTEERFIIISTEDRDKIKAAEIANKHGEALDRIYSKMTMTQGGKMREFIEKRVTQEESLLKAFEDSLKVFQQRYKTVSIDDEVKAVIEMSAQLEAKIIAQQIELDAMLSYSHIENPQIKVLKNQIEQSKNELNNLLTGNKGKTLFIPFAKAPEIGTRLGQLLRDVKIHQEVYSLLIQQLEQAKILEAKDTPKVQFLERANPPYKKSWPKRSIITVFGFISGLVTSVFIVLSQYFTTQYYYKENKTQLDNLFRIITNK
jgi:uncharacterized protein involved in exopolysaccharide biosynthesis